MRVSAALGSCHEERASLLQFVPAAEVHAGWPRAITSIQHVKRTALEGQKIEHVDIAHLAVAEGLAAGHVDESRNSTAQIRQRGVR